MYIFLPSHADPKGTPYRYTVIMPMPLTLLEKKEVALIETALIHRPTDYRHKEEEEDVVVVGCRILLNICEPVIAGDTLQPIVRTCTYSPLSNGVFLEEFDEPYYVPLATRYIPAITVTVELDNSAVHLTSSQMVLHFQ